MKSYITLILACIALWSCEKEQAKVDYVVLSGKIENLKGGTMWMLNFDGWERYINVKDDGTFLDTIHIEKPGAYLIDFEKKRSEIYMSNNANIQLYSDAKDFINTLNFQGDYQSLNNHYAKKAVSNNAFFPQMEAIYTLNAEACKERLQEHYVVPFLESLETVTGISDSLRTLEKNNIQYAYLGKLNWFKSYHPRFTKNEDYKAPEWLEKEANDFSLDRAEDLQYSTAYFLELSGHVSGEASKLMKKDSLKYWDAHTKVVANIKNEAIKNHFLFSRFRNSISVTKNKKEVFDTYLSKNTDESYKKRAAALYQEAVKLEPGQPSPKFVNYENHAGGTASLDDFKGKYVYIDIWATWCGPCKRQIPYLEKIEEQYHGKDIEFVTISVDYKKDYNKWKQMVTEKEMKGIQLVAPDAFNSEFISAFNIQGIPRFILVDPQGNLITARAPLPSDEKLIDLFNELKI